MADSAAQVVVAVDAVPWEGRLLELCVRSGETVLLTTPSAQSGAGLMQLLLGLIPPSRGEVRLFGQPLAPLAARELAQLRSRIGVVPASGGLISNLRVWENLVLPLEFHRRLDRREVELRGRQALEQVGYHGELLARPSDLDLLARKQVMLARALLLEPELLICDGLTLGLARREQERLLGFTRTFQQARPDRVTLHLTAEAQLAAALPEARTFTLTMGSDAS